jgi:hypothetical protein
MPNRYTSKKIFDFFYPRENSIDMSGYKCGHNATCMILFIFHTFFSYMNSMTGTVFIVSDCAIY